ncbi:MAG: rhomboid family intramembrane serine protease [Sandaracinaceae bacterium]
MRPVPIASLVLVSVLSVVFLGTQLRTLATQPHVDGALAAFDDVRRAHPHARLSSERLALAPPPVRRALASLERDRPPVAEDLLLEVALSDVLRASSMQPQNIQGYSPSAPSVEGAVLSIWTHLTLPALVGNLVLLMLFGSNVERRWGRWGPPLLFLAGGIGGLLAHHLAAPPLGPLIGASGGVFGLLGSLMVPSRSRSPQRVGPLPAWSVALFLVLLEGGVAALGLVPTMSHAAHLGGLLAGVGVGAIVERVGLLDRSSSVSEA